jgi:4-hydroxybenzoate polyprenyltransferase
MQKRIGSLFAVVALLLYILNVVTELGKGESILAFFEIEHLLFLAIAIASFISIRSNKIFAAISQSGVSAISGIITIWSSPTEINNGTMLIVMAILIAYKYGAFMKRTKLKGCIVGVAFSVLLFMLPVWTPTNSITGPVAWMLFIAMVLFVVYSIFKDEVSQLRKESEAVFNDIAATADEAIDIASALADKINKGGRDE